MYSCELVCILWFAIPLDMYYFVNSVMYLYMCMMIYISVMYITFELLYSVLIDPTPTYGFVLSIHWVCRPAWYDYCRCIQ